MRVTNSMMSSRMLLNLNKNMRSVDMLYNQLATTKKVNFPSENPILASRALKFRTMVNDVEQYQRNVAQGISWMELTDYAMGNVMDILTSISELSVEGASDQNAYDDRQKIANSIEQYLNAYSAEMLASFAGRYVFSGNRTDQPTTYAENVPGDEFSIKQSYMGANIEKIKSYQKLGATQEPLSYEADILKLAYTGVETSPLTVTVNGTAVTVNIHHLINKPATDASYVDAENTYLPADNEINFIPETGELILGKNIASQLKNGGKLDVEYEIHGIKKGEPNPRVYFECKELSRLEPDSTGTPAPKEWNTKADYTMDDHKMMSEFGVGMKMEINILGKDVMTDKLFADLRSLVDLLRGVELSDEVLLKEYYSSPPPDGLGITDETALAKKVEDQLTREKQRLSDIIQTKYSNMVGIIQRESTYVSTRQTDLGTRINRLELIANRLIDDRFSYKKLLSDNEDVDIAEVTYMLNEATSVYQASLQAGANIIQLTLASFIR